MIVVGEQRAKSKYLGFVSDEANNASRVDDTRRVSPNKSSHALFTHGEGGQHERARVNAKGATFKRIIPAKWCRL